MGWGHDERYHSLPGAPTRRWPLGDATKQSRRGRPRCRAAVSRSDCRIKGLAPGGKTSTSALRRTVRLLDITARGAGVAEQSPTRQIRGRSSRNEFASVNDPALFTVPPRAAWGRADGSDGPPGLKRAAGQAQGKQPWSKPQTVLRDDGAPRPRAQALRLFLCVSPARTVPYEFTTLDTARRSDGAHPAQRIATAQHLAP